MLRGIGRISALVRAFLHSLSYKKGVAHAFIKATTVEPSLLSTAFIKGVFPSASCKSILVCGWSIRA